MYNGGVENGYTAEDFEAQAEHVRAGDIVLIYSGYEPCRKRFALSGPLSTQEAAQRLVDHGVRAVGGREAGRPRARIEGVLRVPLVRPRHAEAAAPWPAYGILLGNDVYIIEGLVNLDRLKGQRVRFAALPLNVPELSGCPVRAVAWIER